MTKQPGDLATDGGIRRLPAAVGAAFAAAQTADAYRVAQLPDKAILALVRRTRFYR